MDLDLATVITLVKIVFIMFIKPVMELGSLRTSGSELFKGSFQPRVEMELLTTDHSSSMKWQLSEPIVTILISTKGE